MRRNKVKYFLGALILSGTLVSCSSQSIENKMINVSFIGNDIEYNFEIEKGTKLIDLDFSSIENYDILGIYSNEELTKKVSNNYILNDEDVLYLFLEESTNIELINNVNELKSIKSDGHYKLNANIDLNNEVIDLGFDRNNPFKGVFNGNGYTISNYILPSKEYSGLFGYVEGSIYNLNVKLDNKLNSNDFRYVGAIAGYVNDGLIRSCSVTGSIEIHTFKPKSSVYLGGLIGRNENGKITLSNSEIDLINYSNVDTYVGGIVAYNGGTSFDGKISYCYSIGSYLSGKSTNNNSSSYVGGLIGFNCSEVENSYSYNENLISRSTYYQAFAGGLVGDNNGGKVNNSFSLSNVTCISDYGYTFLGNVVGRNFIGSLEKESGTTKNLFGFDLQTLEGYTGVENGLCDKLYNKSLSLTELNNVDFYKNIDFCGVFNIKEGYLPSLTQSYLSIPESEEFIEITNVEDFFNIENNLSGKYILKNDLVIEQETFNGIGSYLKPFSGIFDGNNHLIKINFKKENNLKYTGLFSYLNGIVRNLNIDANYTLDTSGSSTYGSLSAFAKKSYIENVNSKISINSKTNRFSLGGLVGVQEEGNLVNCSAEGKINIQSSNEETFVGGLVGKNTGLIEMSYSKVEIEATNASNMFIGGLVGKNSNIITDSYSINKIATSNNNNIESIGGISGTNFENGKILNSYSSSIINSDKNSNISLLGGFVGDNLKLISNCYYLINDEIKYSAGESLEFMDITRLKKEDLPTLANKLSPNFYDSEEGYPKLNYQKEVNK